MHLGTKRQEESTAIPLQTAVVCADCESITENRHEQCPLCGGHSLLNIARLLGNSLALHKANYPCKNERVERFDLEFTIDLKQMELKELNAAIQHINSLIGPRLVRGFARCHISVEPVVGRDEEVA